MSSRFTLRLHPDERNNVIAAVRCFMFIDNEDYRIGMLEGVLRLPYVLCASVNHWLAKEIPANPSNFREDDDDCLTIMEAALSAAFWINGYSGSVRFDLV